MILKGSQRGGGRQLAHHLLKDENEHIEVHDLRGFVGDDLYTAFQESYALSRGTKCKQHLFSLSLNPPPEETVSVQSFENAIGRVESELGLGELPRAIVFHEKEGRRHAHAVWSRIDSEEMKAVNLPYFKNRLRDVSRSLFLEHDWQMPKGLMNSMERDPANFSLAEWQQAKRKDYEPKVLKEMFLECWAVSDSREAFTQALQERGFHLCRGDRRAFVALDFRGEPFGIAKWTGRRVRDVKERLGDPNELPGIEETKRTIADRMSDALNRHLADADRQEQAHKAQFLAERANLIAQQREQRERLKAMHQARWDEECRERAQRFVPGLRGLWHRLTGRHAETKRQNEVEADRAAERDRLEKENQIALHLAQRRTLKAEITEQNRTATQAALDLKRDVAYYDAMTTDTPVRASEHFQLANKLRAQSQEVEHGHDLAPER